MLNLTPLWFINIFLFVFGHMFSLVVEGSTGLASTQLSTALTETADVVYVDSVAGFVPSAVTGMNVLVIDGEVMTYNAIYTAGNYFYPVTRAAQSTDAAEHANNAFVYSRVTGGLNQLLAFRVAQINTVFDVFGVAIQLTKAIVQAVPDLISWDYSFMTGNWIYLRYFGWVISSVLILGLFLAVGSSGAQGLFGRG